MKACSDEPGRVPLLARPKPGGVTRKTAVSSKCTASFTRQASASIKRRQNRAFSSPWASSGG